ncbi:MAG: hypothetical protein KGI39_01995, partial [Patescibacteria group bacterium]|nr:hypothetical protein [Patescibacteria group bacterium]
VNVGGTTQYKTGALGIGGLFTADSGIFVKGGDNKDKWQSVFPYLDGKNYIRGTTIIADNDANNFVGIGTIEPKAKLDVNGSGRFNKIGTNGFSPDSGYPQGWGGGIHTFDVYSDGGTFAAGRNGNVAASLNSDGKLKLADGTQGAGKVLTSDADGNGSWQNGQGSGTLSSSYVGSCMLNSYQQTCTCGQGEKIMLLERSYGGDCRVVNQNSSNVYSLFSGAKGNSCTFSCFK